MNWRFTERTACPSCGSQTKDQEYQCSCYRPSLSLREQFDIAVETLQKYATADIELERSDWNAWALDALEKMGVPTRFEEKK